LTLSWIGLLFVVFARTMALRCFRRPCPSPWLRPCFRPRSYRELEGGIDYGRPGPRFFGEGLTSGLPELPFSLPKSFDSCAPDYNILLICVYPPVLCSTTVFPSLSISANACYRPLVSIFLSLGVHHRALSVQGCVCSASPAYASSTDICSP
jgi:hypothetical protein